MGEEERAQKRMSFIAAFLSIPSLLMHPYPPSAFHFPKPELHWDADHDNPKMCEARWSVDVKSHTPLFVLTSHLPQQPAKLRLMMIFYDKTVTGRLKTGHFTLKSEDAGATGVHWAFSKPIQTAESQGKGRYLYYTPLSQADMTSLLTLLENTPGDIELSAGPLHYHASNAGAKEALTKFRACSTDYGGVPLGPPSRRKRAPSPPPPKASPLILL